MKTIVVIDNVSKEKMSNYSCDKIQLKYDPEMDDVFFELDDYALNVNTGDRIKLNGLSLIVVKKCFYILNDELIIYARNEN